MHQCPACGEVYEISHNCSENRPPEVWEMVEDIRLFLEQAREDADRSDEAHAYDLHSPYRRKLNTASIALMNLKVELGLLIPAEPEPTIGDFFSAGEVAEMAEMDEDALADAADALAEQRASEGRPPGAPW